MLEHQAEWHRLLQRECSQAGLALVSVICGFKHLQKSLFRQDRPGAPIVDPGELARAMGAVVFTSGIENIGIPSFTRELTRAGLRVALYDNSGGSCADEISDLPGVLRLGPGWRTSAVAGQVVGEYLLGAGHRHVAYVSPVADLGWSQDRLAGLEHAMTGPGIDGAVDVVQCARSDLERGRTTYSSLERREALEQTVAWCLQHDDPRFTQLADAIFSYRFDFSNHAGMHETAERLLPLFERAYALPHATAWVCSNDTVALAALRFLSERGVDVPGRISMVGFDDSRSAYLHGLTSYNFGDALLLRIALSHARGFPDASKAAQSVRGFVSVRRSTMRG